jgi:sortase A
MERMLMKRKSKKGLFLMLIGILLLAGALTLTVYNLYIDKYAGQRSEAVVQQLKEQIQEKISDDSYVQEDITDLPLYVKNPEMAMPVISIEGNDYIGILEIPVLDIRLPVMSEWSYPKLKLSPCRYTGTAYMNNMVIAAHNYDSHFGRLKELQPGDSITFTDTDGNLFSYEVADMEILEPTAIEDMKNSGYALTLFTCTYGGKTRYTVRCSLIETSPVT